MFAEESRDFVKLQALDRRVTLKCFAMDRYGRLVAQVRYGFCGRQDLSLNLLRRGLAVVYRGTDASYGDRDAEYFDRIEAKAKAKAMGIWSIEGGGVSPSEYKRSLRASRR